MNLVIRVELHESSDRDLGYLVGSGLTKNICFMRYTRSSLTLLVNCLTSTLLANFRLSERVLDVVQEATWQAGRPAKVGPGCPATILWSDEVRALDVTRLDM